MSRLGDEIRAARAADRQRLLDRRLASGSMRGTLANAGWATRKPLPSQQRPIPPSPLATTMIRRSGDQTIGSSGSPSYPTSFTRIDMNIVVRDDLGGADLANNRINITTPGLYLLVANVLWRPESTATGNRSAVIGVNGVIASASQVAGLGGGFTTTHSLSTVFGLDVGDQVVLDVLQNAGTNRDLEANGFAPYLSATLLRT